MDARKLRKAEKNESRRRKEARSPTRINGAELRENLEDTFSLWVAVGLHPKEIGLDQTDIAGLRASSGNQWRPDFRVAPGCTIRTDAELSQ